MSKYKVSFFLVLLLLLQGCFLQTSMSPTAIEVPLMAHSGVYTAQDALSFPLPTSGYQIYLIGEIHGIDEVRHLTLDYLQHLHRETGLRDLILEEGQGLEAAASAYVRGEIENLPPELCLRADILEGVRTLNQDLPEDEQIRVHLVDLDFPISVVYVHLATITEQISQIALPLFGEFESWSEAEMLAFVDQILEAAQPLAPRIEHELLTTRDSIPWSMQIPAASPEFEVALLRETRITQNIRDVLAELDGYPVLAIYGAAHAQKKLGIYDLYEMALSPWAQRLSEEGIKIYALFSAGMYGEAFWRGRTFNPGLHPDKFLLVPPESGSLETILASTPDYKIVYVDFLDPDAPNLLLPSGTAGHDSYDGLLLFKEFTPMPNLCP